MKQIQPMRKFLKEYSWKTPVISLLCFGVGFLGFGLQIKSVLAASPTFSPRVDYATGNRAKSVATGDFNADGRLDLAVANLPDDTVSIKINQGAGIFLKTNLATYPTGDGPHGIITGDFNGDNMLDLAVTNEYGSTFSILLGIGDGTFGAKTDYGVQGGPISITKGDFNRDGELDLAVANAYSSGVSISLGVGDGTFSLFDYYGLSNYYHVGADRSYPYSIATADFNADGKLDLVTANKDSSSVSILIGVGDGTFGAKVDYTVGAWPMSVTTSDFDRDGDLDLAVANGRDNTVSILSGKGDGTFSAKTDITAGKYPMSVTVGDFNADKITDLAVANFMDNHVSIMLGMGDGTFGAKTDYGVGFVPTLVATGDFNSDGKTDLVTSNETDNMKIRPGSVSVLINTTNGASVPNGDHNLDAIGSFYAFSSTLRAGYYDASGNVLGHTSDEIIVGTGDGLGPQVRVFSGAGTVKAQFFAYAQTLRSGVRVATCDTNSDGYDEIITVSGKGGRPQVRIFKGNGTPIGSGFFALDGKFTGGANVACGDVNGDGNPEIIVAAGPGGGPQVTIYKTDGTLITNFMAYAKSFRGGIVVAAIDIDGNGSKEIITAPEKGAPHLQMFTGKGKRINPGIFAFDRNFQGGLSIAGGDVDGDGIEEILVTSGPQSQALMKIYKNSGQTLFKSFYLYSKTFTGAARISSGDVNGDGLDEIIAIPYSNSSPMVKIYNQNGALTE